MGGGTLHLRSTLAQQQQRDDYCCFADHRRLGHASMVIDENDALWSYSFSSCFFAALAAGQHNGQRSAFWSGSRVSSQQPAREHRCLSKAVVSSPYTVSTHPTMLQIYHDPSPLCANSVSHPAQPAPLYIDEHQQSQRSRQPQRANPPSHTPREVMPTARKGNPRPPPLPETARARRRRNPYSHPRSDR